MTKQMKMAMAAMLMVGTLPMMAQTSETKTVKVAPGQTKETVIHRKNGATDTVISEGTSTGKRSTHRRTAHRAPAESATAREIRELKEAQAAQQAEIDSLVKANAAKDAQLAQAQQSAQGAEAQAQAATAQAQSVSSTVQATSDQVQALKSNVTDLQTTNAGLAATISANKVELTNKIDNPLAIHYKGVTITPVAFFALEGVYRQRSINSDINTPFNTTPFPGSNEGHISEFNFSGRQSRLGGLFEGKAANYKLTGYFEADFLSAGTTSTTTSPTATHCGSARSGARLRPAAASRLRAVRRGRWLPKMVREPIRGRRSCRTRSILSTSWVTTGHGSRRSGFSSALAITRRVL